MTDRKPLSRWLLRRADQTALAVAVLAALAACVGWWVAQGGVTGRWSELEQAAPLAARFEVDINLADWPELMQLPEIGETLAKRIVASRNEAGPFRNHEDLRRVNGIGPKTLERIRPFLRPMPEPGNVAEK